MDTPRRWQVASLATAVVSLGVGGALLARPAVETVPSIDLDQVNATAAFRPEVRAPTAREGSAPRIVLPPTPGSAASATPDSPTSPEEVVTPVPDAGGTPDTAPRAPAANPTVSPVSPGSPASPDSPASVDTPSSEDSD